MMLSGFYSCQIRPIMTLKKKGDWENRVLHMFVCKASKGVLYFKSGSISLSPKASSKIFCCSRGWLIIWQWHRGPACLSISASQMGGVSCFANSFCVSWQVWETEGCWQELMENLEVLEWLQGPILISHKPIMKLEIQIFIKCLNWIGNNHVRTFCQECVHYWIRIASDQ